jgi:hypothetical protein
VNPGRIRRKNSKAQYGNMLGEIANGLLPEPGAADFAIVELGRVLGKAGYRFITPTPETRSMWRSDTRYRLRYWSGGIGHSAFPFKGAHQPSGIGGYPSDMSKSPQTPER